MIGGRSAARSLVGPLIIGVAVWCAAGVVTVASPDSVSPRLAVPAPWWMLPVSTAAAWLVRAWRERPLLAVPAIASTLPWWPLPMPAVALIWTGPLAWLPITTAAACAAGTRPFSVLARALGAIDSRSSTVLAGALTLLLGATAAWSVDPHVPAGDEPHYLVITQSLLKDHDLRIENNHRQRDYDTFFEGDLAPDYVQRGQDGEIYSIHAPGIAVLVLPAFALFGYRGVEVWLLLLSAVTGSIVWRLAWRGTNDTGSAWFAWAAVIGSATFLLHSFAVFPEAPGALASAAAILLLLRLQQCPGSVSHLRLIVVAALLGALPWLHTRLVVLAAGLGSLVVWRLLRDGSRSAGPRWAHAAVFLVAPLVSAGAWLAFFQSIYGTPNPVAPYGGGAGTLAAYIPGGLAGLLFDQQFGLVVYAPVVVAAAVGFARHVDGAARAVGRAAAAVGGAYLAVVATYWMWWAGSPANPARFAVAALPALAIPLAASWHTADALRRRILLTILAISWVISATVIGVDRGDLAWNTRNAEAAWLDWLSPVANLPRGWPSFFWRLDTANLMSEAAFFIHVVLWLAPFVAGLVALRRIGRGGAWSGGAWRLAVSCWLLVGLTLATQLGWWLNEATGLDAARSQVAAVAARVPALEISALSLRRLPHLDGALRIRSEEPGRLDGPAPWLALESVPPGTYALHIVSERPRGGQLWVAVGSTSQPIRTLTLKPLSRQAAALTLPAGALRLRIVPAGDLERIAGHVELEPLHLDGSPHLARAAVPYGATNVFFLDDNAFAEPEGFWVQGERSAEMMLERQEPAGAVVPLTLQNGGARNTVALRTDTTERVESLEPFETRHVEIAGAQSATGLHLTISSSSGFRPSDRGTSPDSRYLGVWVSVR